MSARRLCSRIASVRKTAAAVAKGYQLKFHKAGMDGSAKCDMVGTGDSQDCVYGALFEISDRDKSVLDGYEGPGYRTKEIGVETEQGTQEAVVYLAVKVDADLRPYHWYKEHVLYGARENHLPIDYVKRIESVNSIDDPDSDRHRNEMSIY